MIKRHIFIGIVLFAGALSAKRPCGKALADDFHRFSIGTAPEQRIVEVREMPRLRIEGPILGDPAYPQGIRGVGEVIAKKIKNPQDFQTAIYIGFGNDAGMPYLLPNIRQVVAIGNNPFFPKFGKIPKRLRARPNWGVSYEHSVDVAGTSVSSNTLGFMQQNIPGFRIKNLRLIEAAEPSGLSMRREIRNHMEMDFETSEDEILRHHVHIDLQIGIHLPTSDYWWVKELYKIHHPVIIVKAADKIYKGLRNHFRDEITKLLHENEGLLIEGYNDSRRSAGWEFTGYSNFPFPIFYPSDEISVAWGYTKSIKVTDFRK